MRVWISSVVLLCACNRSLLTIDDDGDTDDDGPKLDVAEQACAPILQGGVPTGFDYCESTGSIGPRPRPV